MDILYAPWRSSYIKKKKPKEETACPFCPKLADDHANDAKHFILKRFNSCAVLLNIHPYNAGHILVIPYEHTAKLHMLPKETRTEIIEVTAAITKLYEQIFDCDGLNMGYNSGSASGGSIPQHLHLHILPRWIGDTGFLAALADTKPISFDLNTLYSQLQKPFSEIVL